MPNTLSHTTIRLSGQRVTRNYQAEIHTKLEKGDKTSYNHIGLFFTMAYKGLQGDILTYELKVQKRFLINERYNIIKKYNKAQKLALDVAALNDELEIQIDKHFKLVKVINTDIIRGKWQILRASILATSPDLKDMVSDFDWQLKEENIQRVFLEDNFYNFLFSNLYNRKSDNDKPLVVNKLISNAMDTLSIPIIEERSFSRLNLSSNKLVLNIKGILDIENDKFPMVKLNVFLGEFASEGTESSLEFDYSGSYTVDPDKGLVMDGVLEYHFGFKDLYKKTTTITFNLKKDE